MCDVCAASGRKLCQKGGPRVRPTGAFGLAHCSGSGCRRAVMRPSTAGRIRATLAPSNDGRHRCRSGPVADLRWHQRRRRRGSEQAAERATTRKRGLIETVPVLPVMVWRVHTHLKTLGAFGARWIGWRSRRRSSRRGLAVAGNVSGRASAASEAVGSMRAYRTFLRCDLRRYLVAARKSLKLEERARARTTG